MDCPKIDRLILAGSSSIHTWRYLRGIAPYVGEIFLVGGGDIPALYRPDNLCAQFLAHFRFMHAPFLLPQIRAWLDHHCFKPRKSKQLSHSDSQHLSTVLHIHQANSIAWYLLLATKNRHIPTLLTCYGSDILQNQRMGWKRMMVKSNINQADHLTVPSYGIARVLQNLCPTVKEFSVLNFGVDQPHLSTVKKDKHVLSSRLHKPLYRIDAILRAWQQVELVDDDWCLTVAGEGTETEKLKVLSDTLGLKRVEFVGFVDAQKLSYLYASSLVYVSVPTSDAVSISLFEAMINGCIPVVSNISANCEAVIDGINGVVHPDCSLRDLSESLLRAMQLVNNATWKDQCDLFNQYMIRTKGLHQSSMQQFAAIYQKMALSVTSSLSIDRSK